MQFIEKDEASKQHFYGNLKYFVTYTANWFVDPAAGRVHFGFGWSLATEEQFYLFWPGLMVLARQRAVWVLTGLMGVVLIAKHGAFDAVLPWLPLKILTSVSPAICLGVIWAWLLNQEVWFERIYRVFGQKFSAPLVFVATALVLHFDLPMFVKELAFSLCVVSCVVREDHGMAWFTTWKPVAYLGTISYGIYLLHMLCANVAAKLLPFGGDDVMARALWKFAGTVVLVVIVASVSFRTYEAFFQKFKDRVK